MSNEVPCARASKRILSPHDSSEASSLAKWWQRLTEPHSSIEEVGARHLARQLSSFAAVIMVASWIGAPLIYLISPPAGLVSVGIVIAIAVTYRVSRSPRYRLAAALLTGVLIVGPVVAAYVSGAEEGIAMNFLLWGLSGILIGNSYLSNRQMKLATLGCLAGVIVVHLGTSLFSTVTIILLIWFLSTMSACVIIMTKNRNLIERERLAIIEARRAELEQLNNSMETMLYVISHDLKEPLRGIQNFSLMIKRRYADRLDDKGQDFLARVVRASERMRVLLDDILQLSRAQRIEPTAIAVPGAEIVDAALGRLESRISETDARISVAPDLPEFKVDTTWASGAVFNLVENAIKYTCGDAPPEVEIEAYRGPRGQGLIVKDRGLGVEPEYREKIFELFQRAVGRNIPGTGAGLAIVRQIAARHGGDAWVEGREGGGSRFVITFTHPGTSGAASRPSQ